MEETKQQRTDPRPCRHGFTLIELLVVIGIIALLIGILVPVVSHVRKASYDTNTASLINTIAMACEAYFQDYQAYPGPIPDNQLQTQAAGSTGLNGGSTRPTSTENCVVGLLGGWVGTWSMSAAANYTVSNAANPPALGPNVNYTDLDGSGAIMIGQGPKGFNPVKLERHPPYIDATTAGLLNARHIGSGGWLWPRGGAPWSSGGANTFSDTNIPEFFDRYPDSLPIIYLRARRGAANFLFCGTPTTTGTSSASAPLPYPLAAGVAATSQYDVGQAMPYMTRVSLREYPKGSGKYCFPCDADFSTTDNKFGNIGTRPVDYASNYFCDPASWDTTNQVYQSLRQKDGFILISAGPDRFYGTADDRCNFGRAKQ